MKEISKVDKKEFEIPPTVFVRDIETKVLQMIVLQALSKVPGVGLLEGNFLDSLLGKSEVKGIYAEQDQKSHQVRVKVEIKVKYGDPIPAKAEQVQLKIVEEITHLTGLHVALVHVVIKSLLLPSLKEPSSDSFREALDKEEFLSEEEFASR